jgi:2-amino-4-hydroxy-6-hydroxymethyldihydropteridine diphosphokinase
MKDYDVIVSLASNYQQEKNLQEARHRLGQILFDIRFSEELWTEPYGKKDSPPYLNQLGYASCHYHVEQLEQILKKIESDMGRTPTLREKGIVNIDLDLMLHNGTRYHLKDWERPYIQQLIAASEQPTDC